MTTDMRQQPTTQGKRFVLGRFYRNPLKTFLQSLHDIAAQSRRMTASEKAILKVDYSLRHDFREGFAPRPHGLDAYTLAGRHRAALEATAAQELREAELLQVRAQLEAAETLVCELQRRVTELDHSRGSLQYIERQREITAARQRVRGVA